MGGLYSSTTYGYRVLTSFDSSPHTIPTASFLSVEHVERDEGGCLPVLASTWRDKLLLQALRETGEEMKRRRQTDREVRARHAAEEKEAAASLHGAHPSDGNSRRIAGGSTVAIVTSQAGGEGRWKPALSRQMIYRLQHAILHTNCYFGSM